MGGQVQGRQRPVAVAGQRSEEGLRQLETRAALSCGLWRLCLPCGCW